MALVRRLLQQPGIDVNAPGQDGTPALHWAVRLDDVETAAALLPPAPTPSGQSLRRDAAGAGGANGNAAMIRLLPDAGADANAPDAAAETMLMIASRVGVLDAVQALLDRGAVVDAKTRPTSRRR